jgi:hypothetical protein
MSKFTIKTGWLSLLILTFTLSALAQTPVIESGQPDELRGVTKVFVGLDARQQDVVVREIKKQLPNLEIVSSPEESDIHLRFFLPPIYAQNSIKNYGIEYTMPLKFAREFVKAYKKANG